jgi:hypothetical protein
LWLQFGVIVKRSPYYEGDSMDELTDWLLEGPRWVQYRTHIDLLGRSPDERDMLALRRTIVDDPPIQGLLDELAGWPGEPLPAINPPAR